ncbi:hypothetical protein C2845_PM07G22030 [Panicum miliaceum]|uniref:Uncharacterized protein n=1 Tax=Panicum miliaceum TaxID=4540 RepID=A0A3L6SNI7_PANMI|nr:hypothetical protein C2845_PM07G22030 [Panicum miliaceum]
MSWVHLVWPQLPWPPSWASLPSLLETWLRWLGSWLSLVAPSPLVPSLARPLWLGGLLLASYGGSCGCASPASLRAGSSTGLTHPGLVAIGRSWSLPVCSIHGWIAVIAVIIYLCRFLHVRILTMFCCSITSSGYFAVVCFSDGCLAVVIIVILVEALLPTLFSSGCLAIAVVILLEALPPTGMFTDALSSLVVSWSRCFLFRCFDRFS